MAGKYSKDELKEMLQRSTFQIVAESGIESITVRKVTEGCHLTAPYLYQCYADIREMLCDAYFKIDREIAGLISNVSDLHLSCNDKRQELEHLSWMIWNLYWEYLMEDRDRAIFYWRFYQSGYYNNEIFHERQIYYKPLIQFARDIGEVLHAPKDVELRAVITSTIDDTASVAFKIHLGYIDKEALTPNLIYRSVFSLLFHLMGIDTWKKRTRLSVSQ